MFFSRKAQIIALLTSVSLLLGLPLGSFQSVKAQTKRQAPAPVGVATKQKPDYSQEAFVIGDLRTSYRFERDGTGQRDLAFRAKVQSEAGVERLGQLIIGYSSANEKLDMDYVRVRKADGSVVSAAATDVQDLTAPIAREAPIYTDLRQKHITVPGLRPGDVLEYRMVWTVHTPLAQNHFWVEHDFVKNGVIVLNDELTVNIPAASKIKLKNEPGFEPEIKDETDRRVYHWKHANLKPASEEDDDKDKEEKEEAEQDADDPHPDVQLTTFQSWDEVGQWYADLQKDRIVPDEKIKVKAEEIIGGKTTEKDKVRALYEFVAKNFRYVSLSLGQGRYQPHAAASVMSNQYGDCKDKHTLLASMLAAAGLRAYPVLLNSTRKLDVDIPSPGQFDHVISAIPLGNETLWADTTAEVAPAGLLSPNLRNKKALMIPTAGPARLETTPAEPPFRSSETVTIEGTVDDLGKLKAHAHMLLRGDAEMYMRIAFRRTPKSNYKNLGFYLGMGIGIEGEVTEIKTSDPADLDKPFEIEFDVAKADFLDWSSKKLRIGVPLPPLNLSQLKGRKANSTKPLELGPPIDISYNVKLTLPTKYQKRLPLPLKVSRDYADYAADYKLEGTSLIGQRTLHLRQREIPAERLQDYRAFAAAVKSDEGQTLALETDVAGTPAIPDSVKVEDLVQAGGAAIRNQNYAVAEQLFKRVVEKDPKHKTVRRDLGFALAQQRKFDEAITVLNEQTKINPFDDYAYRLLGRVYWQQQDYTNAEAAFRKQLEVTPLDQYAHASLGQMLVEARKYKEAVPELERAISLAPEEEGLQVSLGRAYLNLNETDKAIAAFEEAIKIDRRPGTLNDVAYFLSEKSVQLDKALQYAESAVSTTAITLRNVETSSLKIDDMYYVASLAAYWDTLGWVYFQKGDFDSAEKFIRAAWTLQQHGDVGYHLGMIEEKRGKKDEALRSYAQATEAFRSSREARESLMKLAAPPVVDKLREKARQELRELNVINMGQLVPNLQTPIQAEFFVVFAPDATRSAQVIDVKYINGVNTLKSSIPALKALKYSLVFPDSAQTKIIRRGALHCVPKPGGCTFTMISPDLITAVD
jgi:tetratricopeptide (TPR) repeat protein